MHDLVRSREPEGQERLGRWKGARCKKIMRWREEGRIEMDEELERER